MEPAPVKPPHIVGVSATGTPLTLFRWGRGIYDLRYMVDTIMTAEEVAAAKKAGYCPAKCLSIEEAAERIKDRLKDAYPGIYWASNPMGQTWSKWNKALLLAGFVQVPGCAMNRVYNTSMMPPTNDKWVHAFYYIKPGRKEPIEFDFSMRELDATTGDNHNSLWQIGYGGRNQPQSGEFGPGGNKRFLPNYGRLSKNCGIAMGWGLPECGKWLDEEFFTISALPKSKKFPKDWTPFVTYGGLTFAHNLRKLDTSYIECPHTFGV